LKIGQKGSEIDSKGIKRLGIVRQQKTEIKEQRVISQGAKRDGVEICSIEKQLCFQHPTPTASSTTQTISTATSTTSTIAATTKGKSEEGGEFIGEQDADSAVIHPSASIMVGNNPFVQPLKITKFKINVGQLRFDIQKFFTATKDRRDQDYANSQVL